VTVKTEKGLEKEPPTEPGEDCPLEYTYVYQFLTKSLGWESKSGHGLIDWYYVAQGVDFGKEGPEGWEGKLVIHHSTLQTDWPNFE